jgi:hypothetical protein
MDEWMSDDDQFHQWSGRLTNLTSVKMPLHNVMNYLSYFCLNNTFYFSVNIHNLF